MTTRKQSFLSFFLVASLLASSSAHGFSLQGFWGDYKKPLIGAAVLTAGVVGLCMYANYRRRQRFADLGSAVDSSTLKKVNYFLSEGDLQQSLKNTHIIEDKKLIDYVKEDKSHGQVFTHPMGNWLVHPVVLQQDNMPNGCGLLLLATAQAIDELVAENKQLTSLNIREKTAKVWSNCEKLQEKVNGQPRTSEDIIVIKNELDWQCDMSEGFELLQDLITEKDLEIFFGDVDFNIQENTPKHYLLNIGGGHLTMATVIKSSNSVKVYYMDTLNALIPEEGSALLRTVLKYIHEKSI